MCFDFVNWLKNQAERKQNIKTAKHDWLKPKYIGKKKKNNNPTITTITD